MTVHLCLIGQTPNPVQFKGVLGCKIKRKGRTRQKYTFLFQYFYDDHMQINY